MSYSWAVLPEHRLAWSLLAALLLHVALLGFLPTVRPSHSPAAPSLIVRWRPPPEPATAPFPAIDAASGSTRAADRAARLPAAPGATGNALLAAPPILPRQTDSERTPSDPTGFELAETARRMARGMPGPPGGNVRQDAPLSESRAALPALARAMAPAAASERQLADGTIKVTTTAGTVYCLKPPPDFLRSGPTEPLAVPMTCP